METMKTYLGIDWGAAKIGVAIGDNQAKTAVPLIVVKTIDELQEIIAAERPDVLVLGNPVKLSGATDVLQAFTDFKTTLEALGLPLVSVDERLTSKLADKLMGSKKEKAPQDAIAAMLILQTYFDQQIT
jgi:putative Holliday junction resolvase